MDSDILDRLEAEIHADYEKKMEAIGILRGGGMGVPLKANDVDVHRPS